MLFKVIKLYARLVLKIFCRKIIVNHTSWLAHKGPLLLASNHPNSFLDGIIMTILFEKTLYSLARGDAFRNRKHERLLRWMNLLPVYRSSEGVKNLEHNYTTFDSCKKIFENNGLVMIYSEGRCINEWHLRPLKKGTARLAITTWQGGINLTVLPLGLNYSPFRNFGKNVFINFGTPVKKEDILAHESDGKMFAAFNAILEQELSTLVFEIDPSDKIALQNKLFVPVSFVKRLMLLLPAAVGALAHAPLYFIAKGVTGYYFDNDHFDGVLTGILMLAYPLYLLMFYFFAIPFVGWITALSVFIVLPFSAWACVQLKKQV